MVGKNTSQLQQNGNTTSTIIGARDWFRSIGWVGIFISKGAGIPVGGEPDALGMMWLKSGNDVAQFIRRAIEFPRKALDPHSIRPPTELLHQKVPTLAMSLCPRHSWTKSELLLDPEIGGIARKRRKNDSTCVTGTSSISCCNLLQRSLRGATNQRCYNKHYQ